VPPAGLVHCKPICLCQRAWCCNGGQATGWAMIRSGFAHLSAAALELHANARRSLAAAPHCCLCFCCTLSAKSMVINFRALTCNNVTVLLTRTGLRGLLCVHANGAPMGSQWGAKVARDEPNCCSATRRQHLVLIGALLPGCSTAQLGNCSTGQLCNWTARTTLGDISAARLTGLRPPVRLV